MSGTFLHYGQVVNYQECNRGEYEKVLRTRGIEYVEMTSMDKVLLLPYSLTPRYVYICPFEEGERVFLLSEIPYDGLWKNIEKDFIQQSQGQPPMILKTRAAMFYEQAVQQSKVELIGVKAMFENVEIPAEKNLDFVKHVAHYMSGFYTPDELRTADTHDMDEKALKQILALMD